MRDFILFTVKGNILIWTDWSFYLFYLEVWSRIQHKKLWIIPLLFNQSWFLLFIVFFIWLNHICQLTAFSQILCINILLRFHLSSTHMYISIPYRFIKFIFCWCQEINILLSCVQLKWWILCLKIVESVIHLINIINIIITSKIKTLSASYWF